MLVTQPIRRPHCAAACRIPSLKTLSQFMHSAYLCGASQRTLHVIVCQHHCSTCASIAFTTVWKRCLCQHIWRNSGWNGPCLSANFAFSLPAHFSIALAYRLRKKNRPRRVDPSALAAAVTLMSARLAERNANQRAAPGAYGVRSWKRYVCQRISRTSLCNQQVFN